jgi:hypothetical protein
VQKMISTCSTYLSLDASLGDVTDYRVKRRSNTAIPLIFGLPQTLVFFNLVTAFHSSLNLYLFRGYSILLLLTMSSASFLLTLLGFGIHGVSSRTTVLCVPGSPITTPTICNKFYDDLAKCSGTSTDKAYLNCLCTQAFFDQMLECVFLPFITIFADLTQLQKREQTVLSREYS